MSQLAALDVAADAADRLILDEAAGSIVGARVLTIGSAALAAGARETGAADVRAYQDLATDDASDDLDAELLSGVSVVLMRLPKSLGALDGLARAIAAVADPSIVVFAGGRLKYMTVGMNEVLGRSFETLAVTLARQKSRVLIARLPRAVTPVAARREYQSDLGIWVGALGGVFAGSGLDIGTRALVATFDQLPAYETAIDLGCGSGILAAQLKRRAPTARVIASDASADAVASARETFVANGLDVEVVRDRGLRSQPDGSVDLIVLNPPFHDGGAVTTDVALALFADVARVLRQGGELWTVWNSHLAYKPALTRIVGETREVSRTPKFTVTASRHRQPHSLSRT